MIVRKSLILLVSVVSFLAAPGVLQAASLEQRIEAVAEAIEEADEMYTSAKKGHLPSLEAINSLHARLALARRLHEAAKHEAQNDKKYDAGAKLDAAEFLAHEVYEASKH